MSPSGGTRKSGSRAKGMAATAAAAAVAALQKPEVRQEVLDYGRMLVEWVQPRLPDKADRQRVVPWARDRAGRQFGVGRLRSRINGLARALDELTTQRPDLAEAFGPLREEVEQMRQRIPVAEALSGRPRRRMLSTTRDQLKTVEEALADALSTPGDGQ